MLKKCLNDGGYYNSFETTGCFDNGGCPVEVKVISQKGNCQFGHQVDDVVVFNGETIQGRIRLSALYSFLPKVFALQYLQLDKITVDPPNHGGQISSDNLYLIGFYLSHQSLVLERCAHF